MKIDGTSYERGIAEQWVLLEKLNITVRRASVDDDLKL